MFARILVLFLGIFAGVVVAFFAYAMLQHRSEAPAAKTASPVAQAQMVVAARVIPTGALLSADELSFAPLRPGLDNTLAFVSPAGETRPEVQHKILSEIAGAVARQRIEAGGPVLRREVVKPGESGFLAAVLQPGTRAITVAVNVVSGAAGLIYPGDRVDVILTQQFPVGGNDPESDKSAAEFIARNVRVLAVDQQLQATASPGGKLAQTVTLEVYPVQAQAIEVATKLGELSLIIRSLQGNSPARSPTDPASTVWAGEVSAALRAEDRRTAAAQHPGYKVLLFHGDTVETITPEGRSMASPQTSTAAPLSSQAITALLSSMAAGQPAPSK